MLLGGLASAAGNDSDLMKPGMGRTWLEQQGADVQEVLNFVLGALCSNDSGLRNIHRGVSAMLIENRLISTLGITGINAWQGLLSGGSMQREATSERSSSQQFLNL